MIACFTVYARALPCSVGVDHAPKRSAAAGGEVRRKEHAVRGEVIVELIEHDARLNPRPTLLHVDLNDLIEVTREVKHNACVERLPIGACASTARGEVHLPKLRLGEEGEREADVLFVAWIDQSCGCELINAVVDSARKAPRPIHAHLPLKATRGEGCEVCLCGGVCALRRSEGRNHGQA